MKILFINPRFPNSLWRLTGITDILPQRCAQTPLGLLTVAALTPPDFDVELQDENVRPLKFDTDADVVAIACWSIQYGRARHIAEAFRKRGKMVVAGGPVPLPVSPSVSPMGSSTWSSTARWRSPGRSSATTCGRAVTRPSTSRKATSTSPLSPVPRLDPGVAGRLSLLLPADHPGLSLQV